ncbi:GNAT family N-acetyltransferase [Rufibacter psychrotolerans]|uniref:GNAT family N-acetyltransferase n=1 Tax=Rufibacter psychrotolerans TaxID=2812556 RepID=UPI0019682E46|nr:GNAT family N-acetyltransferase [Rufibacter sp. SYSU D00308]
MLGHLEWDTTFFGYKTGQLAKESITDVELEAAIESFQKENYRLVYIRTKQEIENIAGLVERLSDETTILLADKKVVFSQYLNPLERLESSIGIKLYNQSGLDAKLADLALQSGKHSRYLVDPNFRNNEYQRLYTEWIKKSITGEAAQEVWVSIDNSNKINGFITLGKKNNAADIGLLAVDTNSRGKNLGKTLINVAKKRAMEWGETKLQVVTQLDNKPACSFYGRCGFITESIEYIYHIWIR